MHRLESSNQSPFELPERLYLDFDSFFATAEQHFNPALCDKPVGVVPLDSPHTGCIAVSREAKKLGVPSGASKKNARVIVPDMIFVVARPDAYVRLHNRIIDVIEKTVPIAKVRSIDEVVCHLLPSEAAHADALARSIKQGLAHQFSKVLTCSIGVAKTELLAKIGAEMNKPDGFTNLSSQDIPDKIEHLRLQDLPGISKGIASRLAAAGICDVGGLWNIGPKHARALWGSIEGERFWNGLHGLHFERPETVKRMFGHSRMLPLDWRTPEKVTECARQLTMSAGRRLRRAQLRSSKMTISVRGGGSRREGQSRKDGQYWSCEVAFPMARDDHTFLQALSEGMKKRARQTSFRPRSVSVMLHGLDEEQPCQTELFGSGMELGQGSTTLKTRERWECVSDTMDQLRAKHGPSAVSLGPKNDVPGGYVGAKIAFGRIPDAADFSEAQTEDSATHFCSY